MNLNNIRDIDAETLARPIWNNLVKASNDRDYTLFSRDFSSQMHATATREIIEQQWQVQPMLTQLTEGAEYMGCLKTGDGVRVIWKQEVKDSCDEFLGIMELVLEKGVLKVDGALVS